MIWVRGGNPTSFQLELPVCIISMILEFYSVDYIHPVPTVSPKNVTVVMINSTAISVSWNPLTLQKARGWPVYVVYLLSNSQQTACDFRSVDTSDSSVVIGNLNPTSYYSIVVQVSTAAGTSEELRSQPGEFLTLALWVLYSTNVHTQPSPYTHTYVCIHTQEHAHTHCTHTHTSIHKHTYVNTSV